MQILFIFQILVLIVWAAILWQTPRATPTTYPFWSGPLAWAAVAILTFVVWHAGLVR
jgi:hypothetical protein